MTFYNFLGILVATAAYTVMDRSFFRGLLVGLLFLLSFHLMNN